MTRLNLDKRIFARIALTLLFFGQVSFASNTLATPSERIKDIDWLAGSYQRPDIVIVDARKPLEYAKGHIPGAVNLPAAEILSRKMSAGFGVPLSQIRERLNSLGFKNNQWVVVYDEDLSDAARVLWFLESNGQAKCTVLDGGIKAWIDRGLPLSQDTANKTPGVFIPQPDVSKIATKFSTRVASLNTNKVILDVRSEDEFQGRSGIDSGRGHIPNAINIPSQQFFKSSNHLKRLDDLKLVFYRLNKNIPIIVYSNYGKRASLAYLVLTELGFSAQVYDGSWLEWSSDKSLPIE